jgi:CPA1 family monovalent cation:H+ antiporter
LRLALSVPVVLQERTEIISTVFGVVLFTLLVQGLTTKSLLEKLGLLGAQAAIQEYNDAIARWVALNRVQKYLNQADTRPEIDPEFYRYQEALVKGQIDSLQEDINKLRNEYPQLRELGVEQLKEELLAIEADTYAEFVRSGQLSSKLSPVLQEVFKSMDGNTV